VASSTQRSWRAITRFYEANGDTTAMTDPLGNRVVLGYDDRNLLTVVQSSGTMIANYQYDGLGIRVWRTITSPSGGTAATVYDPTGTGNLYGEYFAADYREYVYVNGIPVAAATDPGRGPAVLNYLYADHLGTIRAVAAPTGGTGYLWAWQNNAFGNQLKSGGDNFYNRFPGQYYDVETGLHYNIHRYYDPGTARYLQSDPIGLVGGISTYASVANSPLNFMDPLGLACNGQGCWTTPVERGYLDGGNYLGYYQAACSGGYSYACFAQHVAANDDFMGHLATNRLTNAIEAQADKNKQCLDESRELNQIRSDLANAYANYLPDSETDARFPTDADIAKIHWDEFAKFGLPPATFGGTPLGTWISLLAVVWCPNCTRP
jgi:RHS repeat-associated protein